MALGGGELALVDLDPSPVRAGVQRLLQLRPRRRKLPRQRLLVFGIVPGQVVADLRHQLPRLVHHDVLTTSGNALSQLGDRLLRGAGLLGFGDRLVERRQQRLERLPIQLLDARFEGVDLLLWRVRLLRLLELILQPVEHRLRQRVQGQLVDRPGLPHQLGRLGLARLRLLDDGPPAELLTGEEHAAADRHDEHQEEREFEPAAGLLDLEFDLHRRAIFAPRKAEGQRRGSDVDLVALAELLLSDSHAVDLGAVAAPEVDHHVGLTALLQPEVLSADGRVVEDDIAVQPPTHDHRSAAQEELLPDVVASRDGEDALGHLLPWLQELGGVEHHRRLAYRHLRQSRQARRGHLGLLFDLFQRRLDPRTLLALGPTAPTTVERRWARHGVGDHGALFRFLGLLVGRGRHHRLLFSLVRLLVGRGRHHRLLFGLVRLVRVGRLGHHRLLLGLLHDRGRDRGRASHRAGHVADLVGAHGHRAIHGAVVVRTDRSHRSVGRELHGHGGVGVQIREGFDTRGDRLLLGLAQSLQPGEAEGGEIQRGGLLVPVVVVIRPGGGLANRSPISSCDLVGGHRWRLLATFGVFIDEPASVQVNCSGVGEAKFVVVVVHTNRP